MTKGHDKGHKGQMSDREVMKLALEALVDFGWHIENCPQFPTWAEPKKHPSCTCGYDKAITALRQALEQEPWDTTDMAHRAGGLSMEQEPVDSPEKAGAYMDARLWEFICMAAAWPEAKTDTRIWDHVLVYAPKRPEQEPVAWNMKYNRYPKEGDLLSQIRLVSRREWVGLTDEEICAVDWKPNETLHDFVRAIEAKLKEKNA